MKTVIAANWKMNLTEKEASDLIVSLSPVIDSVDIETIICPPACYFYLINQLSSTINLGAQNISQFESGAYTGELSAKMVKSIGTSFVILGHSERRHIFSETNEMIQQKIEQCNKYELRPILCVGETLEERKSNQLFDVIKRQLSVINSISGHFYLAYEPVWAIGTGETATPEIAQDVHHFIRNEIKNADIPILYGGSVNASNIEGLLAMPDINGALVGGASLKSSDFSDILKKASSLERITQ